MANSTALIDGRLLDYVDIRVPFAYLTEEERLGIWTERLADCSLSEDDMKVLAKKVVAGIDIEMAVKRAQACAGNASVTLEDVLSVLKFIPAFNKSRKKVCFR